MRFKTTLLTIAFLGLAACGSSEDPPGNNGGNGGSTNDTGGKGGKGGTGGKGGSGGSGGIGGTGGSGGGPSGTGGGPSGTGGGPGGTGGGSGGTGGGSGGTGGGSGGTGGGSGGTGGGSAGACKLTTTADVEKNIIAPKCATAGCHAAKASFSPDLESANIAARIVDKAPTLYCKTDKLINTADPAKSFMLLKVTAASKTVKCSSGSGDGGTKMPNTDLGGKALTAEELDCFTWWVNQLAKK